jgi:hypothetical protein
MRPTDGGTDPSTVTSTERPSGDELLQHILRGLLRARPTEGRRGAWRQRQKPSERTALRKTISPAVTDGSETDTDLATCNVTGAEILKRIKQLETQPRWRTGRNSRRHRT